MRSPFANRTNVYRCEDGRPICYCCLRVGHVAKYCWDRRYSCPHAAVLIASQPEQAPKCDFVDVQALGRDVDNLVKELQGITVELELSRAKPFRAEDFPTTTEGVVTDEKDQVEWLEKGSPIMNYGVQWPRRRSFDNADHLSMYNSRNIVSGIVGTRDVT